VSKVEEKNKEIKSKIIESKEREMKGMLTMMSKE
jgi:hypothetical protein